MPSLCSSCKAPIRWKEIGDAGKQHPVDVRPAPNGNILIQDDGTARIVSRPELDTLRASRVPLFLSHFATCPNAAQHRKRGGK